MDKDEYYLNKVKEINESFRTNRHPANNHRLRKRPSEEELKQTQSLIYPGTIIEAPHIIIGWQYCKSCFDIIARVICEECIWKERTIECTHLTKQPQADPTREMCDWCYYQFYLDVTTRRRKPQSGKKCEKCQKVTNLRVMTYQDDTIMIICEDCQSERIQTLRREILDAARSRFL